MYRDLKVSTIFFVLCLTPPPPPPSVDWVSQNLPPKKKRSTCRHDAPPQKKKQTIFLTPSEKKPTFLLPLQKYLKDPSEKLVNRGVWIKKMEWPHLTQLFYFLSFLPKRIGSQQADIFFVPFQPENLLLDSRGYCKLVRFNVIYKLPSL